ncbi:MAG: protein TolQ [Bdellovibrio sp.]|nr:protein TolQ [Bdellovibrio sp.]
MQSTTLKSIDAFNLILQSGLMAKLVLFILLLASVWSWAVIFLKIRTFKHTKKENKKFLTLFWSDKNIEEIFKKSENIKNSPIAQIFQSGFKELRKLTVLDAKTDHKLNIENINRALARASIHETSELEKYIGSLGTVASSTPFIGLFGTVWGIMNSFQNIGITGSANLAIVAPGISEALITTAAGIGAAVPAVIAYNYFVGQIKKSVIDIDSFSQDFLNIIQRSFIQTKTGS